MPTRAGTWREILRDPDVRDAMTDAAVVAMHLGCNGSHLDDHGSPTDDPAYCTCDANRISPLEFVQWCTDEAKKLARNEPAGRPNRERRSDPRLALVMAG